MLMQRFRWLFTFDYMGHKKWYFAISALVIGAGLLSMFIRGGGNPIDGIQYGLEFRTGTSVSVEFSQPVTMADVRTVVEEQGIRNPVIQESRDAADERFSYQIQTDTLTPRQEAALKAALHEEFIIADGGSAYASESVGATFGRDVITASYKAVALALVLILIYVTIRFEWKYAIGALAALGHDLLVVIGVYSLVGRELTTGSVAAILTILGYSLYDNVIVFDRIRENTPRMRSVRYGNMVNRSVAETIVRSINTSLITLVPVLCLLIFGGDTLKDFAFALTVGIVSGAYSTICVASPVATVLKEREPQYRKLAARADAVKGS